MELNERNLNSVMEEIKEKMWDVPFGQSLYQTEKFVLNQYKTKGRAVRQVALELNSRISTIQHQLANIEKAAIDIEELQAKLNPESKYYEQNEFERRRLEVDLNMKTTESYLQEKLLNDVKKEFEYLYSIFHTMPKLTREEFEKEEEEYYLFHLEKQIKGLVGAHESLYQMGIGVDNKGEFLKLNPSEHGLVIDKFKQKGTLE